MANNKLIDLNDHLMGQIERLGFDDLTDEQIISEDIRTRAMSCIAKDIVAIAKIELDGAKFKEEALNDLPKQFKQD